jgi:hypothetical protein
MLEINLLSFVSKFKHFNSFVVAKSTGKDGNDTLIGVDPTNATPGLGEIDYL